jgi:hypothetical protein
MMGFLKLLLSFAPWLSFLIIAHGSMFRLELGLCVALGLSIVMGVLRLHRGLILWVGLAFFSAATVLVVAFQNMWTVQYMGVLANGSLALGTWAGIIVGKPFTLDYAKEHTDPSLWNSPFFLRTNNIIASVWGGAFTLNALLAWMKMKQLFFSEFTFELISYAVLIGVAVFTQWYPAYLRRLRASQQAAA